jgi:enoyl-[acyl-carrier protein] reductase II
VFHTPICDLLGIKYPILQGALGGVASAELVAAVSEAGGLGVLASTYLKPKKLVQEIEKVSSLTNKPFAVNITPISSSFMEVAQIVADAGVDIVTTGRGDPRLDVVGLLKARGAKVIPVVPTVRHARRVEDEGADAVIASGYEAGGHVGKVATLPLVPQVVDAVRIPVIATGGFFDGRGFLAALALGAQGIQMGTRFLATQECLLPHRQKEHILRANEEETIVTRMLTGKPVRCLRTRVIEEWNAAEARGASEAELRAIAWRLRQEAAERNEVVHVVGGQAAGGIHDLPTVAEVIERIIADARRLAGGIASLAALEPIIAGPAAR